MIGCAAIAYLSVTNLLALLRLLPVSGQDNNVGIVAPRHQITVLEWQLGATRPRFSLSDPAFLAACCTGSHVTCSAGSVCWCTPIRCCAGTGTCWRAITLPGSARQAGAASASTAMGSTLAAATGQSGPGSPSTSTVSGRPPAAPSR
jgi:hypothetical protein